MRRDQYPQTSGNWSLSLKIMVMRRLILFLSLLAPLALFSQKQDFRHEIDVYAGYANRATVSGVAFQIQYAFGPAPFIDVLASTTYGTGTRQKWDVRYPKYNIGVTSVGARFRANLGHKATLSFSILTGVDWDLLYEKISPTLTQKILYLHGSLDGRVQMDFLLNPQTSLGFYYDYSFKYPYSSKVSIRDLPDIHSVGIVFGYRFKTTER